MPLIPIQVGVLGHKYTFMVDPNDPAAVPMQIVVTERDTLNKDSTEHIKHVQDATCHRDITDITKPSTSAPSASVLIDLTGDSDEDVKMGNVSDGEPGHVEEEPAANTTQTALHEEEGQGNRSEQKPDDYTLEHPATVEYFHADECVIRKKRGQSLEHVCVVGSFLPDSLIMDYRRIVLAGFDENGKVFTCCIQQQVNGNKSREPRQRSGTVPWESIDFFQPYRGLEDIEREKILFQRLQGRGILRFWTTYEHFKTEYWMRDQSRASAERLVYELRIEPPPHRSSPSVDLGDVMRSLANRVDHLLEVRGAWDGINEAIDYLIVMRGNYLVEIMTPP